MSRSIAGMSIASRTKGNYEQLHKEISVLKDEIERLRADAEYVRNRLTSRDDDDRDTISLRDLIDKATNNGNFFPAYELRRRKDRIKDINAALNLSGKTNKAAMQKIERLQEALEGIKSLLFDSQEGVEFMHCQRLSSFQMQGQFDGAMSEECKASFKRQCEAWDSLIAERDALAGEATPA